MSVSAIQIYDHLYIQLQRNKLLQIFSFKIFLNYWKAVLCPLWQTRKKKKRCNLLPIQNKVISLVAMRSNELWLVQKNHGTITKSNSFSWNENLQRKRSKDGAVMRALVSHQWVPCSIPGPGVICGLGLLLAVFSALRGFSPGSLVFLSPQQFQF